MTPEPNNQPDARTVAHVGPLFLFMLFLVIPDLLPAATEDSSWWVAHPEHWLYPLQTVTCIAALTFWWRHYEFRPHTGWIIAVLAGCLGIAIWILPGLIHHQMDLPEGWWFWFGFSDRQEGFQPSDAAAPGSTVWWLVVAFRFLRLVAVVPLVEEIFWRGFLMRFTVDPEGDYWQVPFGVFHTRSLLIVTLMFVLAHAPADYLAAACYGTLTYFVAVKTKSLSACVLMHAMANLLLGLYVMTTGQWGYW